MSDDVKLMILVVLLCVLGSIGVVILALFTESMLGMY